MSKLSVRDFFKLYPDDDTCLEHVMKQRFGLEHECSSCKKVSRFYKLTNRPAYSCANCGSHVYPCAGTPFERTRTPLQLWFYAIYLFTTTRHGVPAKELQRQLGVTYKTAWRIAHEIRQLMGVVDGDDGLSGHVEMDETYVGGKPRNGRRLKQSQNKKGPNPSFKDRKTAVFGMVERNGRLMARVVASNAKKDLLPLVEQYVEKGTLISTDEWHTYKSLPKMGYQHKTVEHTKREYVKGETHTNTIEGFWGHFKNSVRGTHRSISRKHMQKYLVEFEFRFNLRRDASSAMFDRLVKGI